MVCNNKKLRIQNLETRLISFLTIMATQPSLFASTSVHFFVDDYKIRRALQKSGIKQSSLTSRYRYVLTPDYSLYQEMPLLMMIPFAPGLVVWNILAIHKSCRIIQQYLGVILGRMVLR